MPAALKCANKPVSLVFSGGGVFASQHESCHAALRSHLEASAHPIGELTHHLLLLVERPRIEFAYDTASGQSQRPRGSANLHVCLGCRAGVGAASLYRALARW